MAHGDSLFDYRIDGEPDVSIDVLKARRAEAKAAFPGVKLHEVTEDVTAEYELRDGEWRRNGIGWRQHDGVYPMEQEEI